LSTGGFRTLSNPERFPTVIVTDDQTTLLFYIRIGGEPRLVSGEDSNSSPGGEELNDTANWAIVMGSFVVDLSFRLENSVIEL
jgi:hypothetical protein